MVTTKERSGGVKSGETRAAKAREQAAQFEGLLAQGKSMEEAMQALGISRATAWRYRNGKTESPPAQHPAPTAVTLVALEDLHDNPYQPRTTRYDAAMEELVESIAQVGVLQPPGVRYTDGRREIVWGHRRVQAVRELADAGRAEGLAWRMVEGRPFMDVQVAEHDDEAMRVIALTENLKRTDLTQIEQARAFKRYLDEVPGATMTALAQRVGFRDHTAISHAVRTLTLPALVLDLVEADIMPFAVARELLALSCTTHGMHEDLLDKVLKVLLRKDSSPVTRGQVRHALGQVAADALYHAQGTLRLCEPKAEVYYAGAPAFDVAAFVQGHKDQMHVLPEAYGGDKTYRFTCAVEDWKKAQRELQKEVKDNTGAKLHKEWQGQIRESGQLAALRAAHKAEKLEGKATPAELQALGTMGEEPVKVGSVEWAKSFWARERHFDKSECGTCTKGARWLLDHGRLELHCTNQACFEQKDKEGLAVAKEKAKDYATAEIAQCDRIRELMKTSEHLPPVMAMTCALLSRASGYDLLSTYRDQTPQGIEHKAAPFLALQELVKPKGKRVGDNDAIVHATFGATPASLQALLEALTLRVWQQSQGRGLAALEKALKKGVTRVTEEEA